MSEKRSLCKLVRALLLKSAKQGSLVLVRALLSHPSCDLMARDEEGNTALHIAASSGHPAIVEELAVRYNALSAGTNKEGHTPLHLSCSKGWTKCVNILVSTFPGELQMKNDDGKLPADLASLYKRGEVGALLDQINRDILRFRMQIPTQTSGSSARVSLVSSCLLKAAQRGSLVLVRAILSHPSCNSLARDEKGNTALHVASHNGHHDVVDELAGREEATRWKRYSFRFLRKTEQVSSRLGQDVPELISSVESINSSGNTPLMVASKAGKMCVAKTLLSKYRANGMACNQHNNSCMHLAALHGHIPVIDLLVHEFGCSPHTKGYNSRTPLHYASGGGHVELVDKMISEYKCDKVARDIEGRTPLHMAALHGKKSVVRLLISKHECPVECTDDEGNTALVCASSRGHVSVVIMLHTEFEASVTVKNNSSNTAVHFAALNGHIQMLDLLISRFFCSPHTKNNKNRTPLHCACSGGHLKVVDMLITQYYCNPMARDSSGLIPLHMAALNGRAEVVRLLVTKYGCPVDYTAHNGCTALLFAASMGHSNVVEVLCSELGANVEMSDNNETAAINLAALHGQGHVLSALIEKISVPLATNSTRSPLHQACSSGHLHVVKELISKYNCDPMPKNHDGLTPLHVASGSGKMEVVKDLVTKYSCPVDCVDNEGNTPLHSACSSGYSDVVKLLLSKEFGAKPNSPNNSGSCAVHIAAFYGHTEVFSVLVDGFSQKPEARGYHKRTALHYAAGGGHLEMVEKLVTKYKCDPVADDEGQTPLHIAAACGKENIVRVLITKYSCPVNCVNSKGWNPLMIASREGHATIVKMLASELGASVEARDYNKQTALHIAAVKGHEDVVSVLISEFHCSADSKGPDNLTPLHAACQGGHVDIIQKLINEYKCNRMARGESGATSLHIAAAYGREEAVRKLILKYSFFVDCVNYNGCTPLMVASHKGHAGTVKVLAVEFGANVEARDKHSNTALHYAALRGHMDVVDVLIGDFGCNPESKGYITHTPLHAACRGGHLDIVNKLINEYKCGKMARDENGATSVHIAAAFGREEIVRVLITKHSCPVDCVENDGFTPLLAASSMGHASTVITLASELGADVKARDKDNLTALHHAAYQGHKDVVSVLLDVFGCSPDSKGPKHQTALHLACEKGHMHIANDLINKYKCDTMARNENGLTPLHIAAVHGSKEIVRLLIKKYNCPVDCVDNDEFTPLMLASRNGHLSIVKMLASEFGADVKARDKNNATALHHAAALGHKNVVSVLVDTFGCCPDTKGPGNQTPLHIACERGHVDLADELINVYKCDKMATNKDGLTPLHTAAEFGKEELVRMFITKYNCLVDYVDKDGFTPLMFASRNGHSSTVKVLVSELQADVEARNKNNLTALQLATYNGHKDVVSVFINEFGCNPDIEGPSNLTLLHLACERGHINIANELINVYKCDKMAREENGCTPLHIAAAYGKTDTVRVLVTKYNCPVDCIDNNKQTPLMFASRNGHSSPVKVLVSELGADMEARDKKSVTALHFAVFHGHKDVVSVLIDECGCSPDSKGPGNQTPLHVACEKGHMGIVNELIVVHKCDRMARDDNERTPLHVAAAQGRKEIVRALITNYCCPVDCVDSNGFTPFMFASASGHSSTLKVLASELGANVETRDKNNLTALHLAAFNGHKDAVSLLIGTFGCSPDRKGPGNQTPLHVACQGVQVDIVKLLTDVYGAFPSIKDNQGNTPMDCSSTEALLSPQISTCFAYLHQHAIQERRDHPHKLLLLGESSEKMAELINAHSTYSLQQSHLKENTCFLNYVNGDLQDIWMCQYSGTDEYSSLLLQTLMSGCSFTAMCLVDLDRSTNNVVDEIHSQVVLLNEVIADSEVLNANVIICGVSSAKHFHQHTTNMIYEQAKKIISGSTNIKRVESLPICLGTASPKEEWKKVSPLMKSLCDSSKTFSHRVSYGSVCLLKLMLRDFSHVPCVTFTQLYKHLQDKQLSSEDTYDFLNELDSLQFIIIVGDRSNPETVVIIINPLLILETLKNKFNKSSNPLIKMGLVPQAFLSMSVSTSLGASTILTLLKRFGLPSTKFPLQKIASDVALTNISDTFYFIPHIIADNRQSRKWLLSCDNPFTIGLSLEAVKGSYLFSKQFQYSLLTKVAQHFIGILDSNAELESHVHNAVWQGGTIWALDDVEIMAEVLENGKAVVVMARTHNFNGLKCISLLSQIENIVLSVKRQHCSHVSHKTYAITFDTLRMDCIPVAANVSRVEASNVLYAINSNEDYVRDIDGAKIERHMFNWLLKFTLKGQIFAVEYSEVSHILKQVSGKWREIGRELRVSEKMLQMLQEANLPPEQCCNKVIEGWLMYNGDEPSWYSLTEALRKLGVKHEIEKIMMKWGSYVMAERELKDEDKRNQTITDSFMSIFTEVIEPNWDLLAAYIISTKILQQLQMENEETMPKYGELHDCLNQLITDPVIVQDNKPEGTNETSYTQNEHNEDEVWSKKTEDIEKMEEEKQKQLLDRALEEGHIKTGLDVLLFIGAAGSGKSHYKHLCLGLPPPEVRDSTGLSEHPVRTMSLVRGAVEQLSPNRETVDSLCLQWHEVPGKHLIELIIEAIQEGKLEKVADSAIVAKSLNRTTVELSSLDIEHDISTTEGVSSTKRESIVHEGYDISEVDQMISRKKVFTQSEKFSPASVHYESTFYQDLLRKLKSSTTQQTKRGKLLDVDWIYIVDSGGQPQFREMLPVVVQMATACVLTLKLNEPLGELNEVKYFRKGQELCKPYLSSLTNEQIVKHCSQIVGSQTKDCKLFVVGTHQDLEHECQTECRRDKNEKLLQMLQPQLGTNLEVYKTGDPIELIYPVNSKTPKEGDYRVVEQFRMAVHNITRSKEKVDIPLYWFLLELLFHELATMSGILSFEGCKQQAIVQLKFSEEDFPTAVKFLAQKLGTIMYFPYVLPNVIFTPQALMSILSEIVKLCHILNDSQSLPIECQGKSGEWLEFQRFGIMTKTLLQTAPFNDYFSNIFTANDFLVLMMKLLIVARISDDVFFFPSVLEELSPEGVQNQIAKSRDCLAPLVLCCSDSAVRGRIKENWLAVGSFTSLVTQLLNVNKWTLQTDEMQNPTCLYRNCIQFTLPDNQPGIVTLVDKLRHMEVYLQVDPEIAIKISKVVCSNVYSGLTKVHRSLHYKNDVQLALLCPQHGDTHTATLSRSARGQWTWTCRKDKSISGELTEKVWPWLQDNLGDPKLSDLVNEVVAKLPAKWEAFAVQIELEYECILEIKKNYPRNNRDCFTAVLHEWNVQRTVPFTWERVIAVLRSPALQENRVAENIAETFCPSQCRRLTVE